jgi:Starch-binding associating with outer membrane
MKKILYILSVGLITFSSCKKTWLDVNKNPNTPTTTTPELVFANALNVTANSIGPNQLGSFWGGLWTQSSSFIADVPTQQYVFTNATTAFHFWDGFYDNMFDYKFVIDNATGPNAYLGAYSRVMQALVMQQVIDFYGNAPYSEAFKGTDKLEPKFDDAKSIYEDLIKKLDTAITQIKVATPPSAVSYDIIFKGNKAKWLRLANSVKLRILMRQSYMPGRDAYIVPEINKIVAEGSGFLGAGEDVLSNPGFVAGTAGKINPFYASYGYDQNGNANNRFIRMTALVINTMKSTGDTVRMKRIAYPKGGEDLGNPGSSANANISANYVGIPFGTNSSAYTAEVTSGVGPHQIIRGNQANSMVVMTAAEVQFMLAEAKQKWPAVGLPKTVKEYYEQGVMESFRITGTSAAAATALLTNGNVLTDYAAATDKLQLILTQKWLAMLNYTGVEAWADYRKSGIPNVPISTSASTTSPPVRLYYPITEEASNTANVKAQGTISPFTTKIFWDVN